MAINVQCPSCSRTLGVPDNLLGKKVKCPSCQTIFTAEEPGGAPPPPPPPPMEEDAPPRPSRRRAEADDPDGGRQSPGGGDAIRAKVNTPGILLIVLGSLSILADLITLVFCFIGAGSQGTDPDSVPGLIGGGCCSGLGIPMAAMVIFGGIKMRSLQSYGLAMTGAILAMLNPSPCCCVLGIGVGIWSIIVLMNAEVKAAFR